MVHRDDRHSGGAHRCFARRSRSEADRERKAGVLDRFLVTVADNLVSGRARWIVAAGLAVLAIVGAGVLMLRDRQQLQAVFQA